MEERKEPPPATSLMAMFTPRLNRAQAASASLDSLAREVRYRRGKHPELETGGLSDEEIARRIKEFAGGVAIGVTSEEMTVEQAWAAMLMEQREQTALLKRINGVVQLVGFLLVLGIVAAVILILLGAL